MPIARALTLPVLTKMVDCVEAKTPPGSCGGASSPAPSPGASTTDAGAETSANAADARAERRRIVAECTIDATRGEEASARSNVELFAKAYCERNATCGVPGTSLSTCLGEARGAILATGGDSGVTLYGALRPSAVDELVVCLAAACDIRQKSAEGEVERCLTEVLAKGTDAP